MAEQSLGFMRPTEDPWFSASQAAQAKADPVQAAKADARGFHLRATPGIETLASARLAMLPRLADTSMEVREVAVTLHGNLATDVFLGPAANEQQVRTMKLDVDSAIDDQLVTFQANRPFRDS